MASRATPWLRASNAAMDAPLAGIVMGSKSDWETLRHAADTLAKFGVPHECRIVSAHRTPDLMAEYAKGAASRGLEVIIAGAGGADGALKAGADQCRVANGADETAKETFTSWTAAACKDGHTFTAPAGSFAANAWGLVDTRGNVWEWVDDCVPALTGPQADTGAVSCAVGDERLLRGGSWNDPPQMLELDRRLVAKPDSRNQIAGFRVMRKVD